jgi:protein TonB
MIAAVVLISCGSQVQEKESAELAEATVYMVTNVMPTFRGGDESAFRNWAMTEIVYPESLIEDKVSGRVMVSFVVMQDGTVDKIEVPNESSVHPLLAAEVVRVVKLSPKWEPGLKDDKPVNVRFQMPFDFRLK